MDFLVITFLILIGLLLPSIFNFPKKRMKVLRYLWLYHVAWAFYFGTFIRGDAIGYWATSKALQGNMLMLDILNQKGTFFMYALNYIPANTFNLSYMSGTILYSFIGYIGLIFFYIVAVQTIPNNSKLFNIRLFPALFFLPNLHFWSVAVGKDTLCFFCIGLFMFALLKVFRRLPLLLFSLLLSFLVRPHVALFLMLAFSLAYLFNSSVSVFNRIIISLALLGIGIAVLPKVMSYAKIEETSIQDLDQFAKNKAASLGGEHTGSSIDVSSYPLPLKVFTFLYRPLFFDARNVAGLVASAENFILFYLTFYVFKNKPIYTFRKAPFILKGMLFFLIIGALAFSSTLGNLGIMIRMRNMFLPGLIIYILWSFSLQVSIAKLRLEKRKKLFQQQTGTLPIQATPDLNTV